MWVSMSIDEATVISASLVPLVRSYTIERMRKGRRGSLYDLTRYSVPHHCCQFTQLDQTSINRSSTHELLPTSFHKGKKRDVQVLRHPIFLPWYDISSADFHLVQILTQFEEGSFEFGSNLSFVHPRPWPGTAALCYRGMVLRLKMLGGRG